MMGSDNGKSFKGQELKKYNAANGIKWRFNLARAPWWGGMFERMVRSTKRCLVKAIGLRKLTYEELSTVLAEVEMVINNRPLVYVGEEDVTQPLTPSHLFCGRRTMSDDTCVIRDVKEEISTKEIASRVKLINLSVEHFWKRWAREYLVSLRETHKMKAQSKSVVVKPGDAVMIHDDGLKRSRWAMGIVEETITGNDGVIRGARLRRLSSDGKQQVIERPIQKLYPLEINHEKDSREHTDTISGNIPVSDSVSNENDETQQIPEVDNAVSIESTTRVKERSRPTRKAAIAGIERRRLNEGTDSEDVDYQ